MTIATLAAPDAIGEAPAQSVTERIGSARKQFDGFTVKKPDPTVHRELSHGWMLPAMLAMDELLWKRWSYWYECYLGDSLPSEPIPQIEFLGTPHDGTRRMLEASLDCIPNHGSWRSWGSWQYVSYFLDWILYALGHGGQRKPPIEPDGATGASDRLYQVFCLDAMLLWPHDYFGNLMAENAYGRGQGFYPTPHHVCEMMTRMVCGEDEDLRLKTFCDPCVGTGRFPLYASNYMLRLYCMDIDPTLCKATLVNGFLYAPWLVRPIPWLEPALADITDDHSEYGTDERANSVDPTAVPGLGVAARLSDSMVNAAPPHVRDYLADTEHDREGQVRFTPILKRRKKSDTGSPDQGSLF